MKQLVFHRNSEVVNMGKHRNYLKEKSRNNCGKQEKISRLGFSMRF